MIEYFKVISQEIADIFGRIFASRPYIAILDGLGNIYYIDMQLSELYLEFIQDFIKKNFSLLNIGDHSFPLGGVNLGIFKISPKATVTLYTTNGYTGQLLAFKSRMFDWSQKIDSLIGNIDIPTIPNPIEDTLIIQEPSTQSPNEKLSKGYKEYPVLTKELSGKEKFPIDVARILSFCDGKHTIERICGKTEYSRLRVREVLSEYQKKKWITVKRILE